jgi:hypothetical protein
MTVTIEFEIPEERDELNLMLDSRTLVSVICDVDNRMRSELKHGITFSSVEEVCEWVRQALMEAQDVIY